MLNDEVLGAAAGAAAQAAAFDPDAPRYGEQANIENHPQVTDFVPRRKLAVLATLAVGLGTATATAAIVRYADVAAASIPGVSAEELRTTLAGGISTWVAAVALLGIALLAKLTYSLRRHRVDDYAGRYRVWRRIGWGALATSVCTVAPIHEIAASAATSGSGWSLTAAGAEWWLAPLALVGGWIFVRMMLEISESRPAFGLTLIGAACYVVAGAAALGLMPTSLGAWGPAVAGGLPLTGATFALAGMMVFARYVVLDVQGLIDHAPAPVVARPAKSKSESSEAKVETKPAAPSETSVKQAPALAVAPATTHHAQDSHEEEWSDEGEEDDYGTRKLSKAEKKRLRRQNRAA